MLGGEEERRKSTKGILARLKAEGAPGQAELGEEIPGEETERAPPELSLDQLNQMTDRATSQAESGLSPEEWQLEGPTGEEEAGKGGEWRPWHPEEQGGSTYARPMGQKSKPRRRI